MSGKKEHRKRTLKRVLTIVGVVILALMVIFTVYVFGTLAMGGSLRLR